MTAILDLLLSRPLGWIINICYQLVGSYGLAIILFTLITKILLLPLAIKQQKSSAAMLRMRPKEEQIRKKYANNKDKLNEEIMKLYQEEHYNPMTSGCLPMLIQLPILYALYRVVYRPLTYIMGLGSETVGKIAEALGIQGAANNNMLELQIAKDMAHNMDKLSFLGDVEVVDFNFFGIDLTQTPHFSMSDPMWGMSILWVLPILAFWTSAGVSYLTTRVNPMSSSMGNGMKIYSMIAMPVMSLWFAFMWPSAMSLYWVAQNVIMALQTVFLNIAYNPKRLAEKMEADAKAGKKSNRQLKREAKQEAYQKRLAQAQAIMAEREKQKKLNEQEKRK